MLCAVYKSSKKAGTYLFVNKRDEFEQVPKGLMTTFGTPVLVTLINLANKTKLAMADLDKVKTNLQDQGYYLQLPPPPENLLTEHKESLKKQQGMQDL